MSSQQADVYWGFDPYRFDQTNSQAAIRWVLALTVLAFSVKLLIG